MNDALEEEESRQRFIDMSPRVVMTNANYPAALLKKGRILLLEDDVNCMCSNTVGVCWLNDG